MPFRRQTSHNYVIEKVCHMVLWDPEAIFLNLNVKF